MTQKCFISVQIFDGEKATPYEVDDVPNPINVYGKSKLAGEQIVQSLLEKYFIVRISRVFGEHGNNFVKTMLRFGAERKEINVVTDQIGSPTYTKDLAVLLCDMAASDKYGVYHDTNESYCSWAEFAEKKFQYKEIDVKVNYISSSVYSTKAVRPKNSRLAKNKLLQNGFKLLPCWKDALERFLAETR